MATEGHVAYRAHMGKMEGTYIFKYLQLLVCSLKTEVY